MSEFLHLGQHPDADQLSAFAEHVLPGHERVEMLAHLAECADCRQIVFLGQRAEEAQTPLAATRRSRVGWLKHWGRLWPVAAAVACGLLVVALLQRRHPVEMPQQSEIAVESGAPISPSQMQLPHPIVPGVPASGPSPSPKSSTTAKVTSSLHPSLATPRPGVGGSASVHGNVVTDQLANKVLEFSPNVPVSGRRSADPLSAGTSLNGAIGSPVLRERPLEEQKNNPFNDNGAQPAVLQSQGQPFSQQATAPPPPSAPSRSDIQQSVNQTVVAAEAPMLQTESAVVSANVSGLGRVAHAKSMRAPLPSKLPAASTISNGHETLAVDSAGDLFVSEDAGIRWRQVAHQWTGKAVKVSLASPNSTPEPALSLSADATASKNTETAKPAAVATRVSFELTTDTGGIWSSPDGVVWKQR